MRTVGWLTQDGQDAKHRESLAAIKTATERQAGQRMALVGEVAVNALGESPLAKDVAEWA
jgi:hypothetical protein